MYYPDLTPYKSVNAKCDAPGHQQIFRVGWLDQSHSYTQKAVSEEFILILWYFCQNPAVVSLGSYECNLCSDNVFNGYVKRGKDSLWLGSTELRIFGTDNIVYGAPDLIYHYVVSHHYCPPEEFIRAVLTGPFPGSPEYKALTSRL